ncbi:MAG: class I SAM-dependent rRNA methyltransferase [Prevotellaceae bacterium]|nr:class I SAM-dependent rRNA methyltransferase [Prevotellaceae bacterium]
MYKTIKLRNGKDQSLKRFHPWIFSGAIARMDDGIAEGDIVRVVDTKEEFLAIGHYQIGSIAVRVLSFTDIEINDSFWFSRLDKALQARRACNIIRPDNNTYRLVHGEGDRLPGLIIDIYDNAAIIQAHSVGMHMQRKDIARQLRTLYGDKLTCIYYKSETTLPYKADLNEESGFLYGKASDVVATENGLKFYIDWLKGQKTGFFIDQRDNRSLIEKYSQGKKVLNMFCYTGGFSVYALRGGASMVHSVDSSERAIEMTNRNIALNFPDAANHEAYATDAFSYLKDMDNSYDLIVLDPPAFAKHKDALRNALKGYTRLNAKAMQKIKPGGILFTFSCSQAVNKDQFKLAVFTAAAQSHRFVRVLHQLHQPTDHPINIYHPEGEYLKGLVLYIE